MSIVKWYLFIQILGCIASPIAFVCFHRCRDRGWAYSKLIGIMIPLYVTWLLAHYVLNYGFFTLFIGVALTAVVSAALFVSRSKEILAWLKAERVRILAIEAVFLAAMVFFGTVRAYNPEIESRFQGYGSEKFMDIMFINSVHQSKVFPPDDAWMNGSTINYYWYGYYTCSALCKITGIPTYIGYNLMLVTAFALTTVMVFALAWHLTGYWWAGFAGAVALTILGNPQGYRLAVGWGAEALKDARYVWDSSRVINNGDTINEFPYFSFLWGDLHGHVTSLPFTVLVLACAGLLWAQKGDSKWRWILGPIITALAYGSAVACNNWDLPAYAGVIALSALVFFPRLSWDTSIFRWAGSAAVQRIAAIVLGYAMFLPFFMNFDAPQKELNWGITSKTPIVDFLSMFGYQSLLVGTLLVWMYVRSIRRDKEWVWPILTLVIIALIPIGLYVSYLHTVRFEENPQFSSNNSFVLTGILAAAILLVVREILRLTFPGFLERRETDRSEEKSTSPASIESLRFVVIILFISLGILLGTEYVAVSDFYGKSKERMNTLFKFHFEAWTMLSLVGAWAIALVLGGKWGSSVAQRIIPKILWAMPWAVVTFLCLTFTVKATGIKMDRNHQSVKGRKAPTFDGRVWMEKDHPEDLAMIKWLLSNGKSNGKVPNIVEAVSDETYSYFGRISAFTGYPTVIGWPNHEGIWRRSQNAPIGTHKEEGRKIYNSSNLGESCRLTEKYGIDYIVLAELEREEFPLRIITEKLVPYTTEVFNSGKSSIRSGWNKPCAELDTVKPEGFIDRTDENPPIAMLSLPVTTSISGEVEKLNEPRGVTFGPDGRIYICDNKNFRIQVYSAEGVFERFIPDPSDPAPEAKLGSQYGGPGDVAVAEDGTVYVADTWGSPPEKGYGRIVKFTPDGKFATQWAKPHGFYGPRGVALAPNGDVYVSDTGNKRIQAFDKDGNFRGMWGQEGDAPGQFKEPVGIAIHDNKVYVCDTGNQRVQVFDIQGQWLSEFIPYGWGGNMVAVEPYISVNSEGSIYLTDSVKGTLQVFSPGGDPILKCYGNLNRPTGIEISGDRGAVTESGSNSVKIFKVE